MGRFCRSSAKRPFQYRLITSLATITYFPGPAYRRCLGGCRHKSGGRDKSAKLGPVGPRGSRKKGSCGKWIGHRQKLRLKQRANGPLTASPPPQLCRLCRNWDSASLTPDLKQKTKVIMPILVHFCDYDTACWVRATRTRFGWQRHASGERVPGRAGRATGGASGGQCGQRVERVAGFSYLPINRMNLKEFSS